MDQKERKKFLGLLLINSGVFYIQRIKKRKKRRSSCWIKEWLIKRDSLSAYNTIFKELHLSDQEYFRRHLRMNTEVYKHSHKKRDMIQGKIRFLSL